MEINPFTLQQVFSELGVLAEPEDVAKKIKEIDLGIKPEDEFQSIITWLGNCLICHKIENIPYISNKSEECGVPDLLAVLENDNGKSTFAIEIKSTNKKQLSWSKKYYNKLVKYQENTGLQILVAWKHRSLGLWTLSDLSEFKIKKDNWKLSQEAAFKQNLLGILAGDCIYQLKNGVGLHIEIKKKGLISKNSRSEKWNAVVAKAFFRDGNGLKIKKSPPGIFQLFLSSNFECKQRIEKDTIYLEYTISDQNQIQWLHQCLPILLKFPDNKVSINWREQFNKKGFPYNGTFFKKALNDQLKTFTHCIIKQLPQATPKGLKAMIKK